MMKTGLLTAVLVLNFLDIPSSFAAPGVQPWNTGCNIFYSQWKKKPKHKAFAVATSDSSQACGGSWGESSKKAAEDSARKWCKKYSAGTHCVITKSE